jgi:hypothetical protein
MRITLKDARDQIDTSAIGVQSCSAAFVQLLNESIQRLVTGPENFWELTARMAICANKGIITWPRDVASVLSISVCGYPMTVRNQWFEFLESGYGIRGCSPCDSNMLDRGIGFTFREIRNGHSLKIVTSVAESSGLEMVFLGYDCQGNWIRTQDADGNWRDGVYAPIPTATSTPYFGQIQFAQDGIIGIIKPITNGTIMLYDYSIPTPSDSIFIGVYDAEETRPSYRRSLLGNISTDGTTRVDVVYKREFIPVRNDNDFLMIGNIPALSEMMQAVKLSRQNALQLAAGHEGKAFRLLDREAEHYVGTSSVSPIRLDYRNFGVGGIPNLF